MRPKSIERFELLYFISLGIGVVTAGLTWEQSVRMANAAFVLTIQAFVLLIVLGLVLLISRKGSNISKWVLAVFFVLGAIMYIPSITATIAQNLLAAVLSTFQVALQAAAMYFVFRPDAKPWFQRRQREVETRHTTIE